MKKIMFLMFVLLLTGVNAFAAGDLTVNGTINTGSSGVKFSDGTTQVTNNGAAKAWVRFTGNGANGECPITSSYNVSSVTKTGVLYTITFSTPLADGNYAVTAMASNDAVDTYSRPMMLNGTPTLSSFSVVNNGYAPIIVSVVVFR